MKIRRLGQPRSAFTLVELMVAMALIIFIMYILAEAFAAGTTAFRNLKGVGDMNLRLRTASNILRKYLSAPHFGGSQRLGDSTVWTLNNNGPPSQGFFRIVQSGPTQGEGSDLDGLPSSRTSLQALHFTVRLADKNHNNPSDFFRTTVPSGSPLLSFPFPDSRYQDPAPSTVYTAQWAEVAIYLRDSGTTSESPASVANGLAAQTLFTMYLRQRLLRPDTVGTSPAGEPYTKFQSYLEVSATQDPANNANLYFNSSQDVTMPVRRFGVANAMPGSELANVVQALSPALNPTGGLGSPPKAYPSLGEEDKTQGGNDVLLQDVLSCSVKVLLAPSAYQGVKPPQAITFVDLSDPVVTQYATGNNSSIPNGTTVFDTWSAQQDANVASFNYTTWATPGTAASIPMFNSPNDPNPISIQAIQIIMRVWDARTQQTRQSSIVVPL